MRAKAENLFPKMVPLPVLIGAVIAERKRCGKPTCRCASGRPGDLHGPYHYRYWRPPGGRLRKAYVRPADLEDVRAACARWASQKSSRTSLRREARECARTVDDLLHSTEAIIEAIRHDTEPD